MKRGLQIARWFFITIGVVVLTSVSVDATIGQNGLSQTAIALFATSVTGQKNGCGEGMVRLGGDFLHVCVDAFEASPGDLCPEQAVDNAQKTQGNVSVSGCLPVSRKDAVPWTFVTMQQAQELCARAGKRLITSSEWYRASLGTPDAHGNTECNVNMEKNSRTGSLERCVSAVFAFDMVGNVWEWIDGTIVNGVYAARTLPQGGYVRETDADGIVTQTDEIAHDEYHGDYAWIDAQGVYGMLRGGFYGSGDDGGLYALQAKTAPSFSGNAIGFRCAKDI